MVMEWLDPQSNLIRKFHGTFFAVDSTIQLFDVANKRVFLKRVAPPEGVKADDLYVQPTNQLAWRCTFAELFPLAAGLQWANDTFWQCRFIGNTVTVYSRKMKVVEYADGRTAKHFAATRTRSLCIVPAPLVRRLPDVLQVQMIIDSPQSENEGVAAAYCWLGLSHHQPNRAHEPTATLCRQGLTDAGIDTARLQSIKFSSKEAAAFGAIGRRKGVAAALTGGTRCDNTIARSNKLTHAHTLSPLDTCLQPFSISAWPLNLLAPIAWRQLKH